MQCLGQNYALNEASFFLVRLLQQYDTFTLVEDRQLNPPWKDIPREDSLEKQQGYGGSRRKELEKVWPWFGLTLYIKVRARVRSSFDFILSFLYRFLLGREDYGYDMEKHRIR
jgi:hypothetical protein